MKRAFLYGLILVMACGKDDPKVPEAALLEFPAQNTECTTGVEVTSATSRVEFRWRPSANTDVYEVVITDLISNTTQTAATSSTSQGVTILKGRPFSWRVISRSNEINETATSQTWLFYNAGSQTTYAPFPAQVIAPESGATVRLNGVGETTLMWSGADVDADIDSFEIFLDTANPPATSRGTLGSNEDELVVPLDPDRVYFWHIITTDREGNTSDSGIYTFRTQ